jgi:hypothetical protein
LFEISSEFSVSFGSLFSHVKSGVVAHVITSISMEFSLHVQFTTFSLFSGICSELSCVSLLSNFTASNLAVYSAFHLTSDIVGSHHINVYVKSLLDSFVGTSPLYVGTFPYSISSVARIIPFSFFHVIVYLLILYMYFALYSAFHCTFFISGSHHANVYE